MKIKLVSSEELRFNALFDTSGEIFSCSASWEHLRKILRNAQLLHVTRAVEIPPEPSKLAVLRIFAKALSFPNHFGENWDAFSDCLSDLSWIESDCLIAIRHSEHLAYLSSEDFAHLHECLFKIELSRSTPYSEEYKRGLLLLIEDPSIEYDMLLAQ